MSMSFHPRFIVLKSKRTTIILLHEESPTAGDTLNISQKRKTKTEKHTNTTPTLPNSK